MSPSALVVECLPLGPLVPAPRLFVRSEHDVGNFSTRLFRILGAHASSAVFFFQLDVLALPGLWQILGRAT